MEKLIMLLGDMQFVSSMQTAIKKLEERIGSSDDMEELKSMLKQVKKLTTQDNGRKQNCNSV